MPCGTCDFVVSLPTDDARDGATSASSAPPTVVPTGDDEGGVSRLNLRLPDGLKTRIEEAAQREGLSLNTWLARVAAAAVDGARPPMSRSNPASGSQRYTGWVR